MTEQATLVEQVRDRISENVAPLKGCVEEVAELTALVQSNTLPQRSEFAYVIESGFDGRDPDAAAGAFTQMLREVIEVVLIVQALNDPKGKRAAPTVDRLKRQIINVIAGWVPDGAIGPFAPVRGRLISVAGGAVFYSIQFALVDQLRIER